MAIKKASNMDKARSLIVLDYPFVASILLRRPFIETREVPTLAVDGKMCIYYNPDFVATLTVQQLVWGLCHEVFHIVGQHALRVGTRNHKKWNWAGDAWINDTLDEAKMGERIPDCVDMPGSKDNTVENIYDSLPDGDGGNGGKRGGEGTMGGRSGGGEGGGARGGGLGGGGAGGGEATTHEPSSTVATEL
jgi:uncharacterized membrane protein YgcG